MRVNHRDTWITGPFTIPFIEGAEVRVPDPPFREDHTPRAGLVHLTQPTVVFPRLTSCSLLHCNTNPKTGTNYFNMC